MHSGSKSVAADLWSASLQSAPARLRLSAADRHPGDSAEISRQRQRAAGSGSHAAGGLRRLSGGAVRSTERYRARLDEQFEGDTWGRRRPARALHWKPISNVDSLFLNLYGHYRGIFYNFMIFVRFRVRVGWCREGFWGAKTIFFSPLFPNTHFYTLSLYPTFSLPSLSHPNLSYTTDPFPLAYLVTVVLTFFGFGRSKIIRYLSSIGPSIVNVR